MAALTAMPNKDTTPATSRPTASPAKKPEAQKGDAMSPVVKNTGAPAAPSKAPPAPPAKAEGNTGTTNGPQDEVDDEQIARLAYAKYMQRGSHGFHEQDWHEAEAELRGKNGNKR